MPWKQSSTVEQRERLVLALIARKEPVGAICRKFGVSRQTAYKFRKRFLRDGRRGLGEERRGPKPKGAKRWVQFRQWLLAKRRRRPTWGARKLLSVLREAQPRRGLPSERTVERWLKTAGLVKVRRIRHRIEPVAARAPRRGHGSNQVWTMDWKGWIRTGDGSKIEPLTIRDLGSRYVLWAQPLPRRSDAAVRKVCRRLFRRHGRPKTIRTDLGGPFCSIGPYNLTSLSLWWNRLGIDVDFVHRKAGIDNNAHEQMHGVMQRETASPPARTRQAQLQRLRRWQHDYNHLRAHDGIGGQPPARRYRSKPEKLSPPRRPVYPAAWPTRRASQRGAIWLYGKMHHVGLAVAGLLVGCKPTSLGSEIYFERRLFVLIKHPPAPHTLAHV